MAPAIGQLIQKVQSGFSDSSSDIPKWPGLVLRKAHGKYAESGAPLVGSSLKPLVQESTDKKLNDFLSQDKKSIFGLLSSGSTTVPVEVSSTLVPPECVTADSSNELLRKICDLLTPDDRTADGKIPVFLFSTKLAQMFTVANFFN